MNDTQTGSNPRPRRVAANDGYLLGWQVAEILHVSSKTVCRWAKEGKLPCQRTLGGHRRYPADQIRALAAGMVVEATKGPAVAGEVSSR